MYDYSNDNFNETMNYSDSANLRNKITFADP